MKTCAGQAKQGHPGPVFVQVHPNFANPFLPAFLADPGINGFALSGNCESGAGSYPITSIGDVGIGNPFLGRGGPRGVQLAVKFVF